MLDTRIEGVAPGQSLDKRRHALHGGEDVAPPGGEPGEGQGHAAGLRDPAVKLLRGQAAGVVGGFEVGREDPGIDLLGGEAGEGGQAAAKPHMVHLHQDVAQVQGQGLDVEECRQKTS